MRNTELRAITAPSYKQPHTLRAKKYSIESTYSDLPEKIDDEHAEHDNFTRAVSRRYRDRGRR